MPKAQGPQALGHTNQANHEWPCYNYYVSYHFVIIVTTPVVLIPQVIVTLVCKVISTNCLCIIVKELSTYIHLLYSGNTLYMKPSE